MALSSQFSRGWLTLAFPSKSSSLLWALTPLGLLIMVAQAHRADGLKTLMSSITHTSRKSSLVIDQSITRPEERFFLPKTPNFVNSLSNTLKMNNSSSETMLLPTSRWVSSGRKLTFWVNSIRLISHLKAGMLSLFEEDSELISSCFVFYIQNSI